MVDDGILVSQNIRVPHFFLCRIQSRGAPLFSSAFLLHPTYFFRALMKILGEMVKRYWRHVRRCTRAEPLAQKSSQREWEQDFNHAPTRQRAKAAVCTFKCPALFGGNMCCLPSVDIISTSLAKNVLFLVGDTAFLNYSPGLGRFFAASPFSAGGVRLARRLRPLKKRVD